MPQGHHHHENRKDKSREKVMQQAISIRERAAAIEDRPIAVIDIGEKRISEILREVIGDNDDKFQDSWCAILTRQCRTEDDIRETALEIKNYTPQPLHYYPEKSLQKPITQEAGRTLTIEDVIESPQLVFDEPEPHKTLRKKHSTKPHSYLYKQGIDDDIANLLRNKFPGIHLRTALRMALGLPVKDTRFWKSAEIKILKEKYPNTNTDLLAAELGRNHYSVKNKAVKLGLKKERGLRITPAGSFNRSDICNIFKFSQKHLGNLINNGLIQWRQYKNIIIFHRGDVKEFIKNHPFNYRHDLLDGYWRQYVPNEIKEWETIYDVADKLKWSHHKIRKTIKYSRIPIRYYGDGTNQATAYIIPAMVSNCIESEGLPQPYKVALGFTTPKDKYGPSPNEVSHYVLQNNDGDWILACQHSQRLMTYEMGINLGIKPRFIKSLPSCKRCQIIYNTFVKNI